MRKCRRLDGPAVPAPYQRHFTAAGWYHAAFLVAMCGVTGALWAVTLYRAARAARLRRTVVIALTTALAAGASFVALLAVDAAGPELGSSGPAGGASGVVRQVCCVRCALPSCRTA